MDPSSSSSSSSSCTGASRRMLQVIRSKAKRQPQRQRRKYPSLRVLLAIFTGCMLCLWGSGTSSRHGRIYYCHAFSSPANIPVNGLVSSEQQLQIAFVTGNEMKARELNMILAEFTQEDTTTNSTNTVNSSLVKLRVIKVDLPEIQEVNTEAIAKEKALLGAQLAGGPCVVEDTSLQFTALGGMPGPYIKWFQDRLGSDGLYNILSAYEDKSAQAVCTLAFCPYPHADPVLFTGITKGQIVKPIPGRGFGWDSIFVPDSNNPGVPDNNTHGVPFSCMTIDQKNKMSHRGKAVRQWATWLKRNQQELWERQGGRPAIGHKGLDFKCTSVEE